MKTIPETMREYIFEQITMILDTMCPKERKRYLKRCKRTLGYEEVT